MNLLKKLESIVSEENLEKRKELLQQFTDNNVIRVYSTVKNIADQTEMATGARNIGLATVSRFGRLEKLNDEIQLVVYVLGESNVDNNNALGGAKLPENKNDQSDGSTVE